MRMRDRYLFKKRLDNGELVKGALVYCGLEADFV